MATEDKVIFEVDIEGLESLNDYKKALAELRKEKNGLSTESDRFNELAQQEAQILSKQSKALAITKNQVVAAEGSYDALNQQLRNLKTQWKATGDEVERANLTQQINEVKEQMNGMNESIGNFQHNVGNYEGAIRSVFGDGMDKAVAGVTKLNTTLKALWANPIFALLAGIAAIITGIVKAIKSSEVATNRLNVVLAPLRRGIDAVVNLLQKAAGGLITLFENASNWVINTLEKAGKVFPKLAEVAEEWRKAQELERQEQENLKQARKDEVQNAKDMLEVARLRTQAKDREKYTAQERLAFVREANELERKMAERNTKLAEEEYQAFKERAERTENTAEINDELAEKEAAMYRAQMEYHNKARELLEQENTLLAEMAANAQKVTTTIDKAIADSQKKFAEQAENRHEEAVSAMEQMNEDAMEEINLMLATSEAEMEIIRKQIEEEDRLKDEALRKEEERKKKQKAIAMSALNATSAILGSIADIYENNGEEDAKAQAKAKNLRIAGATMDMLSGIVSAISQAMSLGPIAGPIMGAINAAIVTTAGIANISKIRNTDTSGNSAPSSTPDIGARVSAPAIIQQIPVTRTLTGASEEERLNTIAQNTSKDQRVVLVYSDVEAAGKRVEVQQEETSF